MKILAQEYGGQRGEGGLSQELDGPGGRGPRGGAGLFLGYYYGSMRLSYISVAAGS